jgi:hypothetical protein
MKLSKALLSAILVGVTAQTTTSCGKKTRQNPWPKPIRTGRKGTVTPRCPNLKNVVLKQLGNSLKSGPGPRRVQFRHDLAQMAALV